MARAAALLALALLAAAVVVGGCGEDEGVSAGATVRVYVGASLCAGAKAELGASKSAGDEVRVRPVCLAETETGGRLDLATVGVNARRASEDSSSIAYVEAAGTANRFARPIVEEADIAFVKSSSGGAAMRQVLNAVAEAGSGSLRTSVRDTLE
ncbi:MAG: hypothetical protein H0X42_06090 [Solirubrobacterales bacterium]|nr:hypothetical protein [Solirubrobacterales bacterium]